MKIIGFELRDKEIRSVWLQTEDGVKGYLAAKLLSGAIAIETEEHF